MTYILPIRNISIKRLYLIYLGHFASVIARDTNISSQSGMKSTLPLLRNAESQITES
jgi:hypothetical protein